MSQNELAVLALLLASAVWTERRSRKFYNGQAAVLVVAGISVAAISGGTPAVLSSMLGIAAGFAATAPLFALRAIGGGDVKLAACLGAVLAWPAVGTALLATALWGGAFAAVSVLSAGDLRSTRRIPLAPAFTLGALTAVRSTLVALVT